MSEFHPHPGALEAFYALFRSETAPPLSLCHKAILDVWGGHWFGTCYQLERYLLIYDDHLKTFLARHGRAATRRLLVRLAHILETRDLQPTDFQPLSSGKEAARGKRNAHRR